MDIIECITILEYALMAIKTQLLSYGPFTKEQYGHI